MRAFKLAAALLGAALSSTSGLGREAKPADVAVYVGGHNAAPGPVELGARSTVTAMFASVGVRLVWRRGKPETTMPSGGPVVIQVRLVSDAPPGVHAEALACARPFGDGIPVVTVMYVRIRIVAGSLARERNLLAHVLAHELGHVLQCTNGHAETGLMKAHWTGRDLNAMQEKPLEFTSIGVDLIREGLARLRARARLDASTPSSPETPLRSPAWPLR